LIVYILDMQGKSREQMLLWLSEDKKVDAFEAFEDYIRFVEQTGKSPPDFCVIRLGENRIPGLRAAAMVRQISTDIRIIFISDQRDYALNAYEMGADGYLLCPLEKDKFMKCLSSAA